MYKRKGFFIVLISVFLLYAYYVWGAASIGMNSNGDSKVAYLTQYGHDAKDRPFNTLPFPDIDNISNDTHYFLAWWSPGQYVIPLFFTKIFSCGIYGGELATTIVFVLVGLIGFYFLFLQLGFSPFHSFLSIFFLLLTKQLYWFFLAYGAGELLLFGCIPWTLLIVLKYVKTDFQSVFILTLIGLFGFFCKTTFLISFIAILLFIFLKNMFDQEGLMPNISALLSRINWKLIAILFCSIVSVYLLVYFFYLKGYETPGNTYTSEPLSFEKLARALLYLPSTIPLYYLSVFEQMGSAINKKFGLPIIDLLFLLITAVSGIVLLSLVIKYANRTYSLLLISFAICYFIIFGILYSKQTLISQEPRHFGSFLWLLIPGFLNIFTAAPRSIRIIFGCMVVISLSLNIYFHYRHRYDFNKNFSFYNGIYMSVKDVLMAQEIVNLDKQDTLGKSLFVIVPWNRDLELMVRNNRLLTYGGVTGMPSLTNNIMFGHETTFKGKAEKLIVICKEPETFNLLTTWFPDYARFKILKDYAPAGYYIYTGVKE